MGRFEICLEITSVQFVDGFDVVGEGGTRTAQKLCLRNWMRYRNSGGGVCVGAADEDG